MKNYNKQYKVTSSDVKKNVYLSFNEIDCYFDSSISKKDLINLRNMKKGEIINFEFVDDSTSRVTKLKNSFPRWYQDNKNTTN